MNSKIFRDMSYGVYLTTSMDAGRPVGCVTNSNTQITSSPATFSVSLNHDNYTTQCIRRSGMFAFTVLSEQSDPALIGRFGFSSSRDMDKFEGLQWERVQWVPVVKAGCGYVVCRVINVMETSTHTVFLGEAIAAEKLSDERPMTYRYYHEVIRGTSPKNAPTYIAPAAENQAEQAQTKAEEQGVRYVCRVCGYEHEGELPEGFTCPICRVDASQFRRKE